MIAHIFLFLVKTFIIALDVRLPTGIESKYTSVLLVGAQTSEILLFIH